MKRTVLVLTSRLTSQVILGIFPYIAQPYVQEHRPL